MKDKDKKEAAEFVKLIKKLNDQQKAGLLLTLQGLKIMKDGKKKKR
ncbi:MAG: hypothetical protein J5994_10655 [Ruminococcus sp.]|nr:hypothetical protein [Ruminococcus sp.]